jgi:hypothetical protein
MSHLQKNLPSDKRVGPALPQVLALVAVLLLSAVVVTKAAVASSSVSFLL